MSTSAERRAANRWDVNVPMGYNPNGYYTQASDKKGHSAKITVKVPVNIAGEISTIVQSGKISELRTTQDFVRSAVVHYLHQLQAIIDDPDLERKITMWTIHDDAMKKRQAREQYTEMMVAVEEHIAHLSSTGQTAKLREYLSDLLDKSELAIPEEFRPEYEQNLEIRLRTIGR